MRNYTIAGPDGPANLYAAVNAAADSQLCGAGALVVLNDDLHAARHVCKAHTTSAAAFTSPGAGPIGRITDDCVRLAVPLPRPYGSLVPPSRDPIRRRGPPRSPRAGGA
jgi:L-asparaginase